MKPWMQAQNEFPPSRLASFASVLLSPASTTGNFVSKHVVTYLVGLVRHEFVLLGLDFN
jgi:hypothetical protein